jgi:hypothetical protein
MVWGLTGGVAAGVLGPVAASVIHEPTRVALGWLALVAERTAHARLGELGLLHLVALVSALGFAQRSGTGRKVAAALAVTTLAAAVLGARGEPSLRQALAPGVVRWHAGGTEVVVLGGAGGRTRLVGSTTLAELRRAGVGTIDVLVVADGDVPDEVVELVASSHRTGTVRTIADGPGAVAVGSLLVRVVAVPGRLVVEAVPRGP